jgi:hypothetical protein
MVQYSETAMKYELEPLKVGGILDQAVLILKDNFSLFVKIMLCLQVPVAITTELIVLAKMPLASANPSPEEFAQLVQSQLTFLFVMMPVLVLTIFVIYPITYGVLIHAAARLYLGEPVGVGSAFRAVIGRAIPLAWTWALLYVFTFLGLALCCLPGILVMFFFGLASTVAVVEPMSGMAALRRSWHLMRSAEGYEHYLQLFLLGLLELLMSLQVQGALPFLLERYSAGIIGSLLQCVMAALGTIVGVVFYFSCRCRVENFDLVRLARAVAAAPTTPLEALDQK